VSASRELLVGAVAYHPRVVAVWERFRAYFAERGVPTDYVLYSSYERLVDDLLVGRIDIAWNTNTAYVQAEHRMGGGAQLLGMRDVDVAFRTVIVMRRGDSLASLRELVGRRLALGSRDCGHTTILPTHYLAQEGVSVERDLTLSRFESDLGKHGDTGGPELRIVEAVAAGKVDAGAIGDAMWVMLRTQGAPDVSDLQIVWRSPAYHHCNFTTLPDFDPHVAAAWSEALLAMDYGDASMRQAMDLEGVKRWLPATKEGYADLFRAMTTLDLLP
jgi:phosphonate transport system substrate-binding protein